MNLGQFLTQRSPLPSATVAQHLAAIQSSGSGQTIFCSQINTVIEQQELVITRKAKRSATQEHPVAQPAPSIDQTQKNITAQRVTPVIYAVFQADELAVMQRTESVVSVRKLDERTITRRNGESWQ